MPPAARGNEAAQDLVEEAWARLADLMRSGRTQLASGREVKLTDGECVRLCQWLGAFSPPRGRLPKPILDFVLPVTQGPAGSA